MTRLCKTVCALFLLIGLCSILVAASAQADPDALAITELSIFSDSGNSVLQMTFQNNGSASIDEFGLALAFLDENGMRVFGYADTLEGYYDEACNWYYTPDGTILPGGTYETEDTFPNYAGASDIGVAVRYYRYADGYYVLIPESEWLWQFPDYLTSGPTYHDYYTSPPDSVYDSTDYDYFGSLYKFYLLDDYNAAYYGKNQGGEWITTIPDDSPAADAGLQYGDLIIFVDGVKPTENLYAVEYALAAITNGEKVDWVYERDGVIYTTRISGP